MVDQSSKSTSPENTRSCYTIRIKGHLEEHWSDWLGDFCIIPESGGSTILVGVISDQAALHGVLAQIRDLGLTLLSIRSHDEDNGQKVDCSG